MPSSRRIRSGPARGSASTSTADGATLIRPGVAMPASTASRATVGETATNLSVIRHSARSIRRNSHR
jgi:hypothetical protein